MRRLTKRQRRLAEDALEVVPKAIAGFCRAYPGIHKKLERIDAVSVAHLAVVRAAKTYDKTKSKVTTYFTMAIFNALLKELAREQRQSPDGLRLPVEMADGVSLGDMLGADMRKALSMLPDESRAFLFSRYYEGKTLDEIAGDSGLDRRTVRRRINLAVSQLSVAWDTLSPLR